MTGQVPELMARLSEDYRARTKALFTLLGIVGGVLVFLLVAALIVLAIIRLFMIYVNAIYEAMEPI